MTAPLSGIRVLEVASWVFVPAAGAVLADWGADVIKVEHPVTADPVRGLVQGTVGGGAIQVELANRGKRSVAIDIAKPGGRDLVHRLAATADVFLTSFLPKARRKLAIDVDDIRAHNPHIVYARGSGQGPRGPEADDAGFDGTSFLARGGIVDAFTPADAEVPARGPGAFGDLPGGYTIAGAIAAALVQRERTGVAPVVDVSLLSTAMWQMGLNITGARVPGFAPGSTLPREQSPNALSISYGTKDGRFLKLSMLQSDRFWPDLCRRMGRPEWVEDPRFCDFSARSAHRAECVAALDQQFASRTLDEWRDAFRGMPGAWSVVQRAGELHDDPQVAANGYLTDVARHDGSTMTIVRNPAQFDADTPDLTAAPEHGQHTEEILLSIGVGWEELVTHKEAGDIL